MQSSTVKITINSGVLAAEGLDYEILNVMGDAERSAGPVFAALISNLHNIKPDVKNVEIEFRDCPFDEMENDAFDKTMRILNNFIRERNIKLTINFDTCWIGNLNMDWGTIFALLPNTTISFGWIDEFSLDMWVGQTEAVLNEIRDYKEHLCRNLILMFDAIENRTITDPNEHLKSLNLTQSGEYHNQLGLLADINCPDNPEVPYLVEVFRHLPTTLLSLDLTNLGFADQHMNVLCQILSEMLQRTPDLVQLNLSGATTCSNSLSFIKQILGHLPPRLESLDLRGNFEVTNLGDESYQSVFGKIRTNCPNLKQLNLSQNKVLELRPKEWNQIFAQLQRLRVIILRDSENDIALIEAWSGSELISRFSTIDVSIVFNGNSDWEKIGINILCRIISEPRDGDSEANLKNIEAALENFTLIPLEEINAHRLVDLAVSIFKVPAALRTSVELMLLQNVVNILYNRGCLPEAQFAAYDTEVQSAIMRYKSPLQFTSSSASTSSAAATSSSAASAPPAEPVAKRSRPS